jgi:hypothetical protein
MAKQILKDLDTIDRCRMRLLTLRARVETNWPGGGSWRRRVLGMGPEVGPDTIATISGLLVALPTPLPLHPGGEPEAIFRHDDTDLRVVAGRAVDAALNLLEAPSLDSKYHGHVSMLESNDPSAREPIVIADPTVGLIVATVIGTLEAISEQLNVAPPGTASRTRSTQAPRQEAPAVVSQPKRAGRVPRI